MTGLPFLRRKRIRRNLAWIALVCMIPCLWLCLMGAAVHTHVQPDSAVMGHDCLLCQMARIGGETLPAGKIAAMFGMAVSFHLLLFAARPHTFHALFAGPIRAPPPASLL